MPFSPSDAPPSALESRLKAWGALSLMAIAGLGLVWLVTPSCRRTPATGKQAGGLVLKDEAGSSFRLDRYKGKVVLVDVWATWCPPCRASLPEVAALQKAADSRYAVVAISVDKGGFADIRPFLAEHADLGLQAVVPDNPRSLSTLGDISGIPASFVLDPSGKVVEAWTGYYPGRAEEALRKHLGR